MSGLPALTHSPADIERSIRENPKLAAGLLGEIRIFKAERDFSEFCRQAWHIVEPGRPLVWGWHLQAKCDHLQAVYNHVVPNGVDLEASSRVGISDLIVNEPPRCSKSLFSSVLFPAWVWIKWQGARFLCITYSDQLAERDALKCFNLVRSDWFRSRWPTVQIREVDLETGNKKKTGAKRYDVGDQGGFRVSTTIGGMATGEGGDIRILDDPHNVKKSLSDIERKQANTFIDLTLPTRIVDPKKYATVLVMQRLHQDDATGHQLEKNPDCDLLCLPMEYEGENRCRTRLRFIDPRSGKDELLHPERWDKDSVEKLKNELRGELGEFGVNSQLQQRPTPIGGGTFKPDKLIEVTWPDKSDLQRITRYWDKAATAGSGCYTAGVLMAIHKSSQRTIILDVVRGQWGTDEREVMIKETAYMDLRRFRSETAFEICVEQEPGSGGKDSALMTVKGLSGFRAKRIPATESKEVDWAPLAAQVNLGGVEMVKADWNRALRKEMEAAPFGKYKDQIDAAGRGFRYIWLTKSAWVA